MWLAVAVAATSTKTKSHRMNALFNDKVNSNEDKRMTIVIQKTVAIIKNLNVKYFGETQQSEQQLVETTETKN